MIRPAHTATRKIRSGGLTRAELSAISEATRLHRDGQAQHAEKAYRKLLKSGVLTPEIFSNLAALLLDRGITNSALILLQKALQIAPNHPDAIANHAACLGSMGQWEECMNYSLKAIEADSSNPMAHLWRARALSETKGPKHAISALRSSLNNSDVKAPEILERELIDILIETNQHREATRVISKKARTTPTIHPLGESALKLARATQKTRMLRNILSRAHAKTPLSAEDEFILGELEIERGSESEGILHLLSVVKSRPSHSKAWQSLGTILRRQQNYPKAIACLRRSTSEDPLNIGCWSELVDTMKQANRLSDALNKARQARSLFPSHPQCWLTEAFVLIDMNRTDQAIQLLSRFQSRNKNNEGNVEILNCEGLALLKQRRFNDAISSFRKSLRLSPSDSGLWNNLGMTYGSQGNHKAEILSYQNAIRHNPADPGSHVNLAMAYLAQGDYSNGLKEYEWRLRAKQPLNLTISGRIIDKNEKPSELIICTEQGLGDTIHFSRFLADLRLCHPQTYLTLVCPSKLQKLLAHSCKAVDRVLPIEETDLTSSDHLYLPLMSIPHHCGINPKESQVNIPYINIPECARNEAAAKLRRGIPSNSPIIALTWKGNPDTERSNLSGRSMELEKLRILADAIPNAYFVSLQKGSGSEELDHCSFRDRFVPSQPEISEDWCFVNTAGYMLASDQIVSTDTCNAHLAGALGKQSHLLLAKMCEWRWRQAGRTCDWYPNTKQYRQYREGHWEPNILEVAQAINHEISEK